MEPRRGERSPSSDVLMLVLCRPSGASSFLSNVTHGSRRGLMLCRRLRRLDVRHPLSSTAYCHLPTAYSFRSSRPEKVHAGVGVVGLPVEPVVLDGLDAREPLAGERARGGRAGEVPFA